MNCKPRKPIRRKVKPKKSRVLWRTGRVIKKGPDMRDLRHEVWLRSQGYCEGDDCNARIFENTMEMHHVTFRSHGGSDVPENLLALCNLCHRKAHGQ